MKKVILSELLTKYERSKHARGEEQIQRRISFNTKDYPEYQKKDSGSTSLFTKQFRSWRHKAWWKLNGCRSKKAT